MAKTTARGENRGRRTADKRRAAEEQEQAGSAPSLANAHDRPAGRYEDTLQSGGRLGHPTRENIATRAYAIYTARGRSDGYDIEDWLQAERELRRE